MFFFLLSLENEIILIACAFAIVFVLGDDGRGGRYGGGGGGKCRWHTPNKNDIQYSMNDIQPKTN